MKSVKFLHVSLLALVFQNAFACYAPTYTPGEYYVFYSYDDSKTERSISDSEANILEWRALTANRASMDDIREVVYRYSLDSLQHILENKANGNSFVKYLREKNDREIVDYLILGKQCELERARRSGKWWYPTKEDLKYTELQNIFDRALAYRGARLKSRYLLQAVRAAYSMNKFDLCLKLWKTKISRQPSSAVKTMCQGYIGGIYFRRADYAKAIEHYSVAGDLNSFWWCADNLTKNGSETERIKILYKYQPSSGELAKMLQSVCRSVEEGAKPYIDLRNFALEAASEDRSDNPAMWQYAAAFLTFADGQDSLAMQYLDKAARLKGTPFIHGKIKTLQILLEAYSGKNCNEAFEALFLPKMQWLDSLICKNINTKTAHFNFYGYENKIESIKDRYEDWYTFNNYSQYYPYDMFRKLALSILIPKYIEQKEYARALLLAGAASERLRMLVGFDHNDKDRNWNSDYFTDIFDYMDDLPVESVIEYLQILQSGGKSEWEKFLVEKCYRNYDYLNEAIGTKYLREEKWESAIEYLSKVSSKYVKKMNVYEYFNRDPFRSIVEKRELKNPYPAYKLNYARQMLVLKEKMENAPSALKKAEAMLVYSVALYRSVSDGESWALTEYGKGNYSGGLSKKEPEWEKDILKRSKNLIEQAEKTSFNIEFAAKCNIARVEYFGKNYSVAMVDKYRNTSTFGQLKSECDLFQSYLVSKYIPKHLEKAWKYK